VIETTAVSTAVPRWRWIVFRVVAGLFAAITTVVSVLFVIGTFTDDTQKVHTVHNLSGRCAYVAVLSAGLALAAWRPERQIAAFQATIAASLAMVVAGALGADLIQGSYYVAPVVIVVLWLLHPARAETIRFGTPSIPMLVMTALLAVPSTAYALTQAALERNALPGDPHTEFHHYSGIAATALMLVAAALVASFGSPGARVVAWFSGFGMALFGLISIVYPDHTSAIESPWSWLAIVWGIGFVVLAEMRTHAEGAR
jgi:hypothetical protein